jgi:hypothetical protein
VPYAEPIPVDSPSERTPDSPLSEPVQPLHINEMSSDSSNSTSTNSKLKLNKPPTFDGNTTKYRAWIQKIELFHRAHQITNDEQRIITTLSYMTEGSALDWCQAFTDVSLTCNDFGSWSIFKEQLDHWFKDQGTKEKSRDKLESYRQERQQIDEFVANLEWLFNDTKPTDESEKIRLLQKGAHRELLRSIYAQAPLPQTYAEWRLKILTLGCFEEHFNQQFSSRSTTSATTTSHTPHTLVTNIHPPAENKRTGTGITFGGRGQPMEINKTRQTHKGYNCGQVGHFWHDCPEEKKKINIRAVLQDFEDDEIEALLDEMQKTKEMDFMDGQWSLASLIRLKRTSLCDL